MALTTLPTPSRSAGPRWRYHTIDYTQPLDPPLSDDEAAWLKERLRERQRV